MPMSAAMVEKRRLELRAVSLHLFQKRKPLSCRDDVFSRLAWLITMERAKSFVSTLFLFCVWQFTAAGRRQLCLRLLPLLGPPAPTPHLVERSWSTYASCASRAWRCSVPGPPRASSTAACRFFRPPRPFFFPGEKSKHGELPERLFTSFLFFPPCVLSLSLRRLVSSATAVVDKSTRVNSVSRCPPEAHKSQRERKRELLEALRLRSARRRLSKKNRSSGGNRFHDAPVLWRFEARFGTFRTYPIHRKGCRTKGQRQRVSQRRNSRAHHQRLRRPRSTDLRSQKKTGPPRLGVRCRAGLRLVEAVVTQEHGSQGRGREGEGGFSRRRALS